MEFIKEISGEDLSPSIIFELHRILSKETLDDPRTEGQLRNNDDVYVGDERDSTVIHVPPTYKELPKRINSICEFANA